MPELTRASLGENRKPGPYLARVVNHLDPTYMGGLLVTLIKSVQGDPETETSNIPVKYCSPFAGVMSISFEGNDSSNFDDVQKSYGFWMVPPDIGTTVLVIFIDGDINRGYWIGCVMDQYQNHMVPGIAASRYAAMTPEQKIKYGTDLLPVAEFHKKSRDMSNPNPETLTKPIHPFAERLLQQGLLTDTIRGVTSSSARRETPSQVYGFSTPGPVDPTSKPRQAGFDDGKKFSLPISRLGGTQFVMDDGDTEGQNELVRIRTRTGHQILLHNSTDLIYIANSKGSAWVELTSNGKIDIYAEDSISVHSEQDFNFRADRDINIEARRDINMSAGGDYHLDSYGDATINVQKSGFVTFGRNLDLKIGSETRIESDGVLHLKGSNLYVGTPGEAHYTSGSSMFHQTSATYSIISKDDWKISAGGTSNITSKHHFETAEQIDMNGPAATPADPATPPDPATLANYLPTYSLPNRQSEIGWANKNFYKADDIISIMKRVPTHEPWDHHENINPTQFEPAFTDIGNQQGPAPASAPSVKYNVPPALGTPPAKTGDIEQDNVAAFLWMIRVCEGTSGPDGYKTMFTGKKFDDFSKHPNEPISAGINGKGITSTAAGAYQFLTSTWNQCQRALSLPDFSPKSQDQACVYLLKQQRALEAIKKGDFTTAIQRTNKIWASLPGSPYNQNPKPFNTALAYYQQGGGQVTA